MTRLPDFASFHPDYLLELVVYRAQAPKGTRAPKGMRWISFDEIDGEAFPNVMRKVIAHGMGS
jgi:A/G-specific adenine glycosylase